MKRILDSLFITLLMCAVMGCASDSGDDVADTTGTTSAADGADGTDGTDGTAATEGTDGATGAACPDGFADGAGSSCKMGEPLTDFTIKDCSGTDVTFSEQLCQAKCTLVYFGAGWCVPCRDKQPKLKGWYDKYRDSGFQVVDILRENSGPADLATTTFCEEWRDEYDLDFPVLIDPTDRITATCLGSQAFPVSILVRDNWDVLYQDFTGETPDEEWELLIQECTSL